MTIPFLAPLKNPLTDGGYKYEFLGHQFSIKFPVLTSKQKKDLVKLGNGKSRLDYIHFSSVLCRSRRLAYFTAVNIDGTRWQDNARKGNWQDDTRISTLHQLGQALYDAPNSFFDRGHLVRREDPEWGEKILSEQAGENTFWFPNCSPQHKKLNQEIWAELEANILHTGANDQNLKINVFTGPVLATTDGLFIHKVNGEDIQLPYLFWKVVVWTKSNGKAYAVGFIQSQEKFLKDAGLIRKPVIAIPITARKKELKDEDIFEHLSFKDGKTYQVRIEEIEKLTGLKFDWPTVIRPFKKAKPTRITGIKISPPSRRKGPESGLPIAFRRKYRLKGLTL